MAFDEYMTYYNYYGAAYEQYAEQYAAMGINSKEELMDALYTQYAAQMQSSVSSTDDTESTDDTDAGSTANDAQEEEE